MDGFLQRLRARKRWLMKSSEIALIAIAVLLAVVLAARFFFPAAIPF